MSTLVVFDLDGTLVDSRQDLASAMNDVLAGFGVPPLGVAEVQQMVGEGARTLVQRALARAGCDAPLDEALALFLRAYDARLLETTRPYPGVDDLLRDLRVKGPLALLTNKPIGPTVRLVEHFGWTPLFARVVGGDGPFGRKPDPAGLEHLRAWAGAPREATLLVGDSMVDVETARRAGVAACVVTWGFGAARGDLTLRGDELVAAAPRDIPALWPGALTRTAAGNR